MSEYQFGQEIWNILKADIQNEYGVAGLMGNLVAESGLIPYRLQGDFSDGYIDSLNYTAGVDNGSISENDFVNNGPNGGGYGLAQWTYPARKQNMYNRHISENVSIGDTNFTCQFLLWELQTSYGSVYDTLKNATSILEASNVVLHDFENPAEQGPDVETYRASLGQGVYDAYTGTGGSCFTEPRLTDTGMQGNPYWYDLNPFYQSGFGLPNCTAYCWGRRYEITGDAPETSLGNADTWFQYAVSAGQRTGQTPELGAIACWHYKDGHESEGGHVAIVEVIDGDVITTSNSAYGGAYFYTQTLNPPYEWASYTVLDGFIYLNCAPIPPKPQAKKNKMPLWMYLFP